MEDLEGFEKIKQGAEARIYVGKYLGKFMLVKERFVKKYRNPELDNNLTKERIKAEVRGNLRCRLAGIPTPAIYLVDLERRSIFMEYMKGLTVKEFIEKSEADCKELKVQGLVDNNTMLYNLGLMIGNLIAQVHSIGVVHGDLTSSNILICPKNRNIGGYPELRTDEWMSTVRNSLTRKLDDPDFKLVLIDFGLGKVEMNVQNEEKGVDLYVLERALKSAHPRVCPEPLFVAFMKGYKDKLPPKSLKEIIKKYEEIRMRGRKRTMVG